MSNREGTPIWYELLTDDPDAAQDFYGSVIGWTFSRPAGGLERDYRILSASDSEGVGGLMRMDAAKMPPTWLVYIGVDDVDAAVEKLKSLGGRVHIEPTDIPGVGRFAFVADPQGALFYLMRGDSDQESHSFASTAVGHCAWNELVTSDQIAALDFYGAMFGWTRGDAMPMGDGMGDYTFIQHGEPMIGAMMNATGADTKPFWNFAFRVDDIDKTKSAIESGGGTVRQGPMEVPGGDWVILATDPQGAKVMFVGSRTQ